MPKTPKETTTSDSQGELVPHKSSPLAEQTQEWFDPSMNSDPEDRVIAYSRLIQKTSKERETGAADVGDILTSTGLNLGKRVVIIPLWFQKTAAKFDSENNLECRSADGETGDKYGECRKCPYFYRNWKRGPDGKQVKPECTYLPTFPSLVVESDNVEAGQAGVIAFQFPRTSTKVAKQIITEKERLRLPAYAFKLEISTRIKPFPKGPAAVYEARFLGRNDMESMRECQAACQALQGVQVAEPVGSEFPGEEVESDEIPF